MKQLLEFIKNVIDRYLDIERDGYQWIDAVVDVLEDCGFEGYIGKQSPGPSGLRKGQHNV